MSTPGPESTSEAALKLFPLSPKTSSKIPWDQFLPDLELLHDKLGGHRGPAKNLQQGAGKPLALPAAEEDADAFQNDLKTVKAAFAVFKTSFQEVLGPLQKRNRILSNLVYVSIAVAIIGSIVSAFYPLPGVLLTLSNLGSLIALLRTVWRLDRDQSMLILVPARYQLAITLCNSHAHLQQLITMMLRETSSLRSDTDADKDDSGGKRT